MSSYKFEDTKNEILKLVSTCSNDFEKCFVVRNIFSRFALYVIFPNNFSDFKNKILESFLEWIDDIKEISPEKDNFIYEDLSSTSYPIQSECNVFFSERHIQNTNWFVKDKLSLKTPVSSFYSFKGGVGRTTAMILSALILAREGKKVLLIDFDLEAPGLTSIFANQANNTQALLSVKGFVDFLIDYNANKQNIENINIDDYYFTNNDQKLVGTNGGELVIVPAIASNMQSANSYIDKLSKANITYKSFGQNYVPDLFLKSLEKKIKPDFILIDTRTGINDIGGIVFNRYAQNIFLVFYGNPQNMFGLESILPELKKLNEKDVNFYLLNSPVPKNETDAETETNYYIENTYRIFSEYFYAEDDLPDQFDETADHYPINISFDEQAMLLNNYKKLSDLIASRNNAYKNIADIILSFDNNDTSPEMNMENDNDTILECMINIDKGKGTSEVEFKEEKDLKTYFYPRKDYRYIFDKHKFLILGDKGVGKTALFSVLSHREYATALAKYCGVSDEDIDKIDWIIGFEKEKPGFPARDNFQALNDFKNSQFRNYWRILLLKQIEDLLPKGDFTHKIIDTKIKDIKNLAKEDNIGEELHEILLEVNEKLRTQNKILIIVYDYLDAELPTENALRGRLISALLSFYYDNLNRFSNLKAKIFLRNDIFTREVTEITDKVKIQNYAVEIQWEYEQLLNIIWKRIYEQNSKLSLFEKDLNISKKEGLGVIPTLSEKEHKSLLDKIFGKRMGGNNKAYPYNWVKLHIEDTRNIIHPRTLIKLFSESAKLQKEDKENPKDRIIRSKNIQTALKESVSKHQVQELGEEYPELKNIFDNLSEKVGGRSPMNENDLVDALKNLEIEEPLKTIEKLKEIGLLKDYKPYAKTKTANEEKRYHIPDLYLFGLNLTRKGTK